VKAETDDDRDARTRALTHAVEFGIDLTLLIENLKYSPTERVRRAQRSLRSLVALDAQSVAYRQRHRRCS
jgi:hypothetical protein